MFTLTVENNLYMILFFVWSQKNTISVFYDNFTRLTAVNIVFSLIVEILFVTTSTCRSCFMGQFPMKVHPNFWVNIWIKETLNGLVVLILSPLGSINLMVTGVRKNQRCWRINHHKMFRVINFFIHCLKIISKR